MRTKEERRTFMERELISQLMEIGKALRSRATLYLIGGCAMVLRGSKVATKDVDAVLTSPHELAEVVRALREIGYVEVKELPRHYEKLGASAVLRNQQLMQFDLYYKQVCNGLEITDSMRNRARLYAEEGNLSVYLMAPEDIILFKSITERSGDLADMAALAGVEVDWDVIVEECAAQGGRRIWLAFLYQRLLELRRAYGVDAPVLRKLKRAAEEDLVSSLMRVAIERSDGTFEGIARYVRDHYDYGRTSTRRMLHVACEKGAIKARREGKRYRYSIA